ncbi:MAG TPA: DUF6152 family protein, partial [Vicinamibacterales bacterium]|nr:DUF6152 family protein [Vicinamibacterales bacterium]
MKMSLVGAVGAVVLLTGTAVSAHHSSAGIDRTKTVELTGTVRQFGWTNPHSWMEVDVPDQKGGTVTWKVEMTSPAYLVRAGWKSTTVKQGDEVKVTVRPLRDGSPGGLFVSVLLADGRTLSERPVTAPQAAA